jgi:hypothetical protein
VLVTMVSNTHASFAGMQGQDSMSGRNSRPKNVLPVNVMIFKLLYMVDLLFTAIPPESSALMI